MERRQGGQAERMSKKPKKRRPEIMHPSLKLLTPVEKRIVEERLAEHRKRWEYLFNLNVWKPSDGAR